MASKKKVQRSVSEMFYHNFGPISEERIKEIEEANGSFAVWQNVDCVLMGDLMQMIEEIREYRKKKA